MNDAEGMRFGDDLAGLQDEVDRFFEGQGATLLEPMVQVPTFQELHHHVWSAGFQRAHVEDAGHVLALDLDRVAGFAGEAADRLGVGQHLGQEKLDGDLFIQPDVVRATTTPIPPAPRTRSTRYLPARIWPSVTPAASRGPFSATRSPLPYVKPAGIEPSPLCAHVIGRPDVRQEAPSGPSPRASTELRRQCNEGK